MIKRFFDCEASSGIILIVSALLAVLLANIDVTQNFYTSLLSIPIEFRFGDLHINKNVLLWINESLMVIFFLFIGLEVKWEMLYGVLTSREKAIFPLIAAVGGMLIPGLIFLIFNGSNEVIRVGWAIPTSTDIAFALGVLALLGNRVSSALSVFLMALAIVDDLGSIIIIALFYTNCLSPISLSIAVVIVVSLALLNYLNVQKISLYIILGVLLWVTILKSGVHTTLAGAILGFSMPLKKGEHLSPAVKLKHDLRPWVNWLILPLFSFANAGISLNEVSMIDLFSPLPLGIILGLFIGKPLGIILFCWFGIRLGIAKLPQNSSFVDIVPTSMLCGIGFTMSIFIASIAYSQIDSCVIVLAKMGVLIGSLLSATVGLLLYSKLHFLTKKLRN